MYYVVSRYNPLTILLEHREYPIYMSSEFRCMIENASKPVPRRSLLRRAGRDNEDSSATQRKLQTLHSN